MSQLCRDLLTKSIQKVLKQLESLGFILVQRIALGISTETDNAAQMLEGEQMIAPFLINGLQQQLLFDRTHRFSAKRGDLLGHHLVGRILKAFLNDLVIHALFFRPSHHRLVKTELFDTGGV